MTTTTYAALAWTGFALVAASAGAYWTYTLAGVSRLRSWLGRPRALALLLGEVLCVVSIAGVAEERAATAPVLVPATLGFALFYYAAVRQWAAPAMRQVAAPMAAAALAPEALVAIVPGGQAMPLASLAVARTVATGDTLVVHCPLAGGLAAFRDPGPVAAVLPLREGFEIAGAGGRWDGLDGRALDDGADLACVPVALATLAAWRARFPEGELLAPPGAAAPGAARRAPRPLVPGARGVADPMHLGVVEDGRWTALEGDALARCPDWAGARGGSQRYLARWAARARGLCAGDA